MRVRWIEAIRAAWGAALLFAPDAVLSRVHHVTVDDRSRRVARVLGARHLAQAALSGLSPSREVLAMGVWVDGVHAASAVGLAVADRSRARAGLTDALVAGGYAAAGWRDLGRPAVSSSQHDRRRDRLARWTLDIVPFGRALQRRAGQA